MNLHCQSNIWCLNMFDHDVYNFFWILCFREIYKMNWKTVDGTWFWIVELMVFSQLFEFATRKKIVKVKQQFNLFLIWYLIAKKLNDASIITLTLKIGSTWTFEWELWIAFTFDWKYHQYLMLAF